MPAPAFVEVTSVTADTDDSVGVAYSGLTEILVGDLLFLFVVNSQIGGTVGTISTPSGWTSIHNPAAFRDGSNTLNGTMALFYRIADGTEAGSVDVSRTGSTGGMGQDFLACMAQFRGTRPIISTHQVNQESAASTITWNAVSFSAGEATAIGFEGQLSGTADSPAGYTEAISSGNQAHISIDYKEDVASAPSVTASGGSSDGWATIHLVIFNALGRSFIVN